MDNWVVLSKLEAYENLGLRKSTVVKLVVCCPLLLVGDVNFEFVSVLDWLKRIGIESDWMVNYLSCSRTYSWKRMLMPCCFFIKWVIPRNKCTICLGKILSCCWRVLGKRTLEASRGEACALKPRFCKIIIVWISL